MSDRFKATLSLIIQGLLAAGLCATAAGAQQASASAPAGAIASGPAAADAKATADKKTGMADPATPSPSAASEANTTGVSNPDPVSPEVNSEGGTDEQNATSAGPAPEIQELTAPNVSAPSHVAAAETQAAVSGTAFETVVRSADAQEDDAAQASAVQTTPSTASTPADPAPSTAGTNTAAGDPAATTPAPAPSASSASTAETSATAAPDNATAPAHAATAEATQTSTASQATAASPAPATTAPASVAAPSPEAPAATGNGTADTQSSAAPAPSADMQTSTPSAAAPADATAPQTSAPAPDTGAQGAPSAAPAGDASASQPDSQAINPSLPAPQVNELEPPPASRIDLFGGYTYLRPSGKVGSWSFPEQNTRGYIASGTYYFTRHFGVQAEFQHSEYPLGTTGTSPAPPFVQLGGVTDSFYTAEAGGVYRFFVGQHLIPFVHATGGAAKVAGPKFQPPTWGYGFAGGGGVDVLIPHTGEHVAFRLVQADFGYKHADQGALTEYDLTGGTEDVKALRLSVGLVIRLGEMNPIQAKSLACDATPAEVYSSERVTLAATLRNYKDKGKNPFSFAWELSAGKQLGYGPVIFVDTAGLAAGTYHATARISAKQKGRQFAQCSANFVVKQSPAPTLKCSPDPSTVTPGQISVITAYAGSIPQRTLTYSYSASEGEIHGQDNTAQLHTDGLPPGVATVTCKVVDDLGQTAVATTEVTIAPPSLPPAPKAQPLCTVYFNRDPRRPARVDNEGRACLDDITLTMEHQPDARLVLVGEHSDTEADGQLTAAERAINTRAYLANEKGIDPSRMDVRTSTTTGRQVQTFLLAPGAVFDQPTEGQIDESKVKIHGQQYARQKVSHPQKGPVGYGVSHPPKN